MNHTESREHIIKDYFVGLSDIDLRRYNALSFRDSKDPFERNVSIVRRLAWYNICMQIDYIVNKYYFDTMPISREYFKKFIVKIYEKLKEEKMIHTKNSGKSDVIGALKNFIDKIPLWELRLEFGDCIELPKIFDGLGFRTIIKKTKLYSNYDKYNSMNEKELDIVLEKNFQFQLSSIIKSGRKIPESKTTNTNYNLNGIILEPYCNCIKEGIKYFNKFIDCRFNFDTERYDVMSKFISKIGLKYLNSDDIGLSNGSYVQVRPFKQTLSVGWSLFGNCEDNNCIHMSNYDFILNVTKILLKMSNSEIKNELSKIIGYKIKFHENIKDKDDCYYNGTFNINSITQYDNLIEKKFANIIPKTFGEILKENKLLEDEYIHTKNFKDNLDTYRQNLNIDMKYIKKSAGGRSLDSKTISKYVQAEKTLLCELRSTILNKLPDVPKIDEWITKFAYDCRPTIEYCGIHPWKILINNINKQSVNDLMLRIEKYIPKQDKHIEIKKKETNNSNDSAIPITSFLRMKDSEISNILNKFRK
jgi:hypothetical protein